MSAIFVRHNKYLNERYYWTDIPYLFPSEYFARVLDTAIGFTDPPTGYAMVEPGVIDLDRLEVVRI